MDKKVFGVVSHEGEWDCVVYFSDKSEAVKFRSHIVGQLDDAEIDDFDIVSDNADNAKVYATCDEAIADGADEL